MESATFYVLRHMYTDEFLGKKGVYVKTLSDAQILSLKQAYYCLRQKGKTNWEIRSVKVELEPWRKIE